MNMLEVSNLHKIFNKGTVNERYAVSGVNLDLKKGDYVAVIGGNGAGKSTLLNCIAGLYIPDWGTIKVGGVDVTKMAEHKRAAFLGRVFQDPMQGTAGDMWLEENLALANRRGKTRNLHWGVTPQEKEEFREKLSALSLGLEDRLTTKVRLLSGGQRQALALLMATLKEPRLLLLDEHTAALDPKTAITVMELTDRMVEESKLTTMMVTHNMRVAIEHGNRLIMMAGGKIVVDVAGQEKKKMTVAELLDRFETVSGEQFASDRALLG